MPVTLQVACGGYHTLAVCAHDSMQQEQAEKQRGYKQKVMQLFSKPVTVDVPDSRQHSSGPNTAGSGGITPLDRVSDGSMSLMNHGSNGMLTTPNSPQGVTLGLIWHPVALCTASCLFDRAYLAWLGFAFY